MEWRRPAPSAVAGVAEAWGERKAIAESAVGGGGVADRPPPTGGGRGGNSSVGTPDAAWASVDSFTLVHFGIARG